MSKAIPTGMIFNDAFFFHEEMPSSGLVWYIDGKFAPEIWMRRGLTYSIYVHGGNNPHSAEYYNPLIITDEPHGGYERLSEQAQKHVKVLAGVQFTLRGQARPTAGSVSLFDIFLILFFSFSNTSWYLFHERLVGPLCLARRKGTDMRLDDQYASFKKFNRTLSYTCEAGKLLQQQTHFFYSLINDFISLQAMQLYLI